MIDNGFTRADIISIIALMVSVVGVVKNKRRFYILSALSVATLIFIKPVVLWGVHNNFNIVLPTSGMCLHL